MSASCQIATVTIHPSIDQTLTIPAFARGEVNRVLSCQHTAGGKGNNAAAFLADYGFQVTATGFLGAENDLPFRQFFAAKGIRDRFIRIPGETRTCIKIIDPDLQQTTDINLPGLTPSPEEIGQLMACLDEMKAGCGCFILSGSLPPRLPVSFYREMAGRLKDRLVAIDTSGEALRQALEAHPDIIKPNLAELESLFGEPLYAPAAVSDAARRLSDRFKIQLVVVSMGKDGAVLVEGEKIVWAIPPAVAVKTTVGAGDAMLAGVIAGKMKGLSVEDCARLGSAFSVNALEKIGAGLVSLQSVEEAFSQVRLVHPLTGEEISA